MRASAESDIGQSSSDPLGLDRRRGTAVFLDAPPQGGRRQIDRNENAKGSRDTALISDDFLVSRDSDIDNTPRYNRRALAADPYLSNELRPRRPSARAPSQHGGRNSATSNADKENDDPPKFEKYKRRRSKKAEESALELLDDNAQRQGDEEEPKSRGLSKNDGNNKSKKKKRRRRRNGDDADDENEDPYERNEMLSNYVERMKWKPMAESQRAEVPKLLFNPEIFVLPDSPSLQVLLQSARSPEAEGFYVGEPPRIYSWNLRKLERRLRWTEQNHGEKWFGPDQKLAISPDPLRYRMYRPGAARPMPMPHAVQESDPLSVIMKQFHVEDPDSPSPQSFDPCHLVLKKAMPSSKFKPIMDSSDGTYLMIVRLGNISFSDHPLMTEEIKIAREIENWISMLKARKRVNVVGFLSQKLEALRRTYGEYAEQNQRFHHQSNETITNSPSNEAIYLAKPVTSNYYSKHLADRDREHKANSLRNQEKKIREIRKDIRATRLLRDTESQVDRLLEYKILEGWDKIKKIRESTGIVTSQIRVRVRVKESVLSPEEELEEIERDLIEELEELRDLHQQEYEENLQKYETAVQEAERRRIEKEEEEQRKQEESAALAAEQGSNPTLGASFESMNDETDQYFTNDDVGDESDWRKIAAITSRDLGDGGKKSKKKGKRGDDAEDSNETLARPTLWERFRRKSQASPTRSEPQTSETDVRSPSPTRQKKQRLSRFGLPPLPNAPRPRLSSRSRSRDPASKSSAPPLPTSPVPKRPSSVSRSRSISRTGFPGSPGMFSEEERKNQSWSSLDTRRRSSSISGDRPPPMPSTPVPRRPSLDRRASSRASTVRTRGYNSETDTTRRGSRSPIARGRALGSGSAESTRSNLAMDEDRSKRRSDGDQEFGSNETMTKFDSNETIHTDEDGSRRKRRSSKKRRGSKRRSSKLRRKSSLARSTGPLLGSQDELPPKPLMEPFDEDAARNQIIERLRISRKPPGAPILAINHVFSETTTEMARCPKDEQNRKRLVNETYLYARFYYNDKEVTRTLPRPIDPERFVSNFCGINALQPTDYTGIEETGQKFRLEEATVFGIRVKEIPESIRIAIYETNVYGEQILSEVFLGIPEPSEIASVHDHRPTFLNFVCKPFSRQNSQATKTELNLWTAGELKIHAVWGVDEMGNSLGPPLKLYREKMMQKEYHRVIDPLLSSGPSGLLNLRKLMDWIKDSPIDANDPQNGDLVGLKELVERGTDHGLTFYEYWTQRQFFRLDIPKKLAEACFGVGLNESTFSKRLSLLRARHDHKVVVSCPIPFRDEDIHEEMFEKIIDPSTEPGAVQNVWTLATPFTSLETLESNDTPAVVQEPRQISEPSLSLRFLKRIRTHQLIHRARQTRPKRVEDFVREERFAEAPPQQNILFTLFNPKRPLKPLRSSRSSRATAQPENGCFIAVQVQRAYNIPIRKQDVKFDDAAQKGEQVVRSSVVEGPNPQWNETLSLEVRAPNNDFRPESILDNDIGMEMVYFNLFDEIMVDMVKDDRDKDTIIHQRKERNWLGGFSLPFTSIYEQTRVEGAFRVKVPPVLLSYEKTQILSSTESSMILNGDPTSETVLFLFITLEPPLIQPPAMNLKFQSDETHRLLQHANQYTTSFPAQRRVIATALDLDGRTQCILRFIRPQTPPPDLPTIHHLQRFVAHIPLMASRTALAADVWLWCTSDQVLELGAADVIEHAILLCNFLLHPLGGEYQARVVMGWGIPEGRTAYVGVWERGNENDIKLINAVTGEDFNSKDGHIPLREVWSVFDSENIWGNCGNYQDPARINWNLSDGRQWRPFFSSRFHKMELKSLQTETLTFKEIPSRFCRNLEHSIETAVATKMEEWRGHRVTRWNRLCGKSFKSLVTRLEADHLNQVPTTNLLTSNTGLLPLRNVYRICGFPLHTTFTDLESIVEMVHATDVHANADPSVEFSLAVWCGGYPGETEGFGGLAITGCKRMVKENPSYKCLYFFKPPEMEYDDRFTQLLIKNFTADPSIVHVVGMGGYFSSVMKSVAFAIPKLTFSLMDALVDNTFPSNIQGIVFSEDESGFIAGVAAGSVTATNVVAVLGGNPVPAVQRFVYGFLNGVKYANPTAIVLGTFLYDPRWSNLTIGPAMVQKYLAQNADVFFGAGGNMGSAAILHAAQSKKWVIGVDVDESLTTFQNLTESNYLLGSATKNIDQATYTILTEKIAGKFSSGNKRMDSTNGGVGLSRCIGEACGQLMKTTSVTDVDGYTSSCAVVSKRVVGDYILQMISRIGMGAVSTGVQFGVLQGVGKNFNKTWSKLEGFGFSPEGLVGHTQNQITGNKFVFYGGQQTSGNLNNRLYFLNMDSLNWTSIVPTEGTVWPPALQNHGMVFQRSTQTLILVGGIGSEGSFNLDVWQYSIPNNTWSIFPTFGMGPGQDDGANSKKELWKLSLHTQTWTLIQTTSSTCPDATISSSFLSVNNTDLLLFGGTNGISDTSDLWRFSTLSNTWTQEDPFPQTPMPSLTGAATVSLDNHRVMFFGGSRAKVAQANAYIYNALTSVWSSEPSMTLPYGLQGMTALAFTQTDAKDACSFDGVPEFTLCTPVNKTIIVVYGGAQAEKGISPNLLAAYAPNEIPPRYPQYVQDSVLRIGYTVGSIGLIFSLLCFLCTLHFRKSGAFRSASPPFLFMYCIGSATAFIGIIVYNLTGNILACKAALWLFSEGCMMLFSAMVVKNWRIYYLFQKAKRSHRAILRDWVLLVAVLVVMLVNTFILIAFTVLAPYQMGTIYIDGDAWPICTAPSTATWLWILLSPITLILLVGIFVGFTTRNVTSEYNESGQITLSIYITFLSLIILIPLSLTIKLPSTLHIMNSLLVCMTLYTVLASNFFTKIYRDVKRTVDGSVRSGTTSRTSRKEGMSVDEKVVFCCRTCKQPVASAKLANRASSLVSLSARPAEEGSQNP
ncbi:Coiled-coil and C2 domain-containing protein 2A [Phlyctochytrium planicorne]|nr:Coiled-coil and C2 domain-containing protein 2A [Phlyctochytrium planicorne]